MRIWLASDPDPNAEGVTVSSVVDDHGEVWCFEDEVHPCACGHHVCDYITRGWWSPTLSTYDLVEWEGIFGDLGDGNPPATRVHELTPEEERELCGEMFS